MAKLCPKGKAAAKRKFKVYPSAYANMYASAVCSGKVTPGGRKGKAAGGILSAGATLDKRRRVITKANANPTPTFVSTTFTPLPRGLYITGAPVVAVLTPAIVAVAIVACVAAVKCALL